MYITDSCVEKRVIKKCPFDKLQRDKIKLYENKFKFEQIKGYILISTYSAFYQSYIFFELNNAPLGLVDEMLGIIDVAFWNAAHVSPSRNGRSPISFFIYKKESDGVEECVGVHTQKCATVEQDNMSI